MGGISYELSPTLIILNPALLLNVHHKIIERLMGYYQMVPYTSCDNILDLI